MATLKNISQITYDNAYNYINASFENNLRGQDVMVNVPEAGTTPMYRADLQITASLDPRDYKADCAIILEHGDTATPLFIAVPGQDTLEIAPNGNIFPNQITLDKITAYSKTIYNTLSLNRSQDMSDLFSRGTTESTVLMYNSNVSQAPADTGVSGVVTGLTVGGFGSIAVSDTPFDRTKSYNNRVSNTQRRHELGPFDGLSMYSQNMEPALGMIKTNEAFTDIFATGQGSLTTDPDQQVYRVAGLHNTHSSDHSEFEGNFWGLQFNDYPSMQFYRDAFSITMRLKAQGSGPVGHAYAYPVWTKINANGELQVIAPTLRVDIDATVDEQLNNTASATMLCMPPGPDYQCIGVILDFYRDQVRWSIEVQASKPARAYTTIVSENVNVPMRLTVSQSFVGVLHQNSPIQVKKDATAENLTSEESSQVRRVLEAAMGRDCVVFGDAKHTLASLRTATVVDPQKFLKEAAPIVHSASVLTPKHMGNYSASGFGRFLKGFGRGFGDVMTVAAPIVGTINPVAGAGMGMVGNFLSSPAQPETPRKRFCCSSADPRYAVGRMPPGARRSTIGSRDRTQGTKVYSNAPRHTDYVNLKANREKAHITSVGEEKTGFPYSISVPLAPEGFVSVPYPDDDPIMTAEEYTARGVPQDLLDGQSSLKKMVSKIRSCSSKTYPPRRIPQSDQEKQAFIAACTSRMPPSQRKDDLVGLHEAYSSTNGVNTSTGAFSASPPVTRSSTRLEKPQQVFSATGRQDGRDKQTSPAGKNKKKVTTPASTLLEKVRRKRAEQETAEGPPPGFTTDASENEPLDSNMLVETPAEVETQLEVANDDDVDFMGDEGTPPPSEYRPPETGPSDSGGETQVPIFVDNGRKDSAAIAGGNVTVKEAFELINQPVPPDFKNELLTLAMPAMSVPVYLAPFYPYGNESLGKLSGTQASGLSMGCTTGGSTFFPTVDQTSDTGTVTYFHVTASPRQIKQISYQTAGQPFLLFDERFMKADQQQCVDLSYFFTPKTKTFVTLNSDVALDAVSGNSWGLAAAMAISGANTQIALTGGVTPTGTITAVGDVEEKALPSLTSTEESRPLLFPANSTFSLGSNVISILAQEAEYRPASYGSSSVDQLNSILIGDASVAIRTLNVAPVGTLSTAVAALIAGSQYYYRSSFLTDNVAITEIFDELKDDLRRKVMTLVAQKKNQSITFKEKGTRVEVEMKRVRQTLLDWYKGVNQRTAEIRAKSNPNIEEFYEVGPTFATASASAKTKLLGAFTPHVFEANGKTWVAKSSLKGILRGIKPDLINFYTQLGATPEQLKNLNASDAALKINQTLLGFLIKEEILAGTGRSFSAMGKIPATVLGKPIVARAQARVVAKSEKKVAGLSDAEIASIMQGFL